MTTLGEKATGNTINMINLVLLVSGSRRGITERYLGMYHPRRGRRTRSKTARTSLFFEDRRRRVVQLNEYLEGMLHRDLDKVLQAMGTDPQSVIRDYVEIRER